jgi:hypothetical protein
VEAHETEHLALSANDHFDKLGELLAQLIAYDSLLLVCVVFAILGEDGVDHRKHHSPLAFAVYSHSNYCGQRDDGSGALRLHKGRIDRKCDSVASYRLSLSLEV